MKKINLSYVLLHSALVAGLRYVGEGLGHSHFETDYCSNQTTHQTWFDRGGCSAVVAMFACFYHELQE